MKCFHKYASYCIPVPRLSRVIERRQTAAEILRVDLDVFRPQEDLDHLQDARQGRLVGLLRLGDRFHEFHELCESKKGYQRFIGNVP